MVVRRKKKSRYMRGSRTHGYGQIGQHRKSGSRGGVGAVGFHKHMWTWVVKYYPDWFGKHGFTRPPTLRTEVKGINVGEVNELVKYLIAKGELRAEGEVPVIDLAALGYNKLLGRGSLEYRVKVRVYSATERAIKKVEEAGGEVEIISREES